MANADPSNTPNFRRQWLIPIVLLSSASLAIFWLFYSFDVFRAPPDGASGLGLPFSHYVRFDPDHISDAVSSLAGMSAAVFGIVITVVSIVVQLSAERYTGVARMFMRDRVNLTVAAYYVVCCVCGVWLSVSLQQGFVPRYTLVAMMLATTGGLVLMAPYFSYVFWFLEPNNIISRIRREAVAVVQSGAKFVDGASSAQAQAQTLSSMEELTDITSNSISGKDKIIASGAVDALKDFTIDYVQVKPGSSDIWFNVGGSIRSNPDFVAMDPESLHDLEQRRTWVEWKVMRQYLGIYNEALGAMRDICYLVAIDTRYIGEAAARAKDDELITLVFRFMNSYLRSTLNARDVRTAYNVLNQYRLLVESMLRLGHTKAALEGVKHMQYYGHVSFDMKLTFVTETIAYDVSSLCQYARELEASIEQEMVDLFLELDRPTSVRSQERGLMGVRKAQVKLAAYYLLHGDERRARMIADDMADEPAERLLAIRTELERVTTKDFWEIIDRGRNFEYMPPRQRAKMEEFFGWLNVSAAPPSGAPEA
ncbi:MAG: DUF2254 domain-containing protein [Myxococcales bacterium]|nr:DUF2254 domain-containing protein [Myxococcales bacterium]